MKRRISVLLVVVLIALQFLPGYLSIPANAEGMEKAILYSEDSVQISAESVPVNIMEDEADLSAGKYLKLIVNLDENSVNTQVFQYEQDPGITEVSMQEEIGTKSIKLDNEEFSSGSEITFSSENQVRTLEVSLYTKAKLTVHYQDEEGNILAEDSVTEGKLNDTIVPEVKEVEGYEVCKREEQVFLDAPEKEVTILYRKAEESSIDPIDEDMQEVVGEEKENNTSMNSDEITAYYEQGYEMNIEGKEVRFVIETPPVQGGTLIVKLPAFFKLTSIPSSKDEYTVYASTEKINETDGELGKYFNGVNRQVITFEYKDVTSAVNISFEIKQSDDESDAKALTQAMILAGEHPDQVPLNIDIFLNAAGGSLLNQNKLQGSSRLSKENEMIFEENIDPANRLGGENFWAKNENLLYLTNSGGGTNGISLEKFHYPYTNVELWIPYDKENKLKSFNDGDEYHRSEWKTITTKEYNGISYFVGAFNEKEADSYAYDTVGEPFQEYNMYASGSLKYIRLIFDETVQAGETISFEHPALLRYTYKGKEETKEIYKIGDYTFASNCSPQIFWKDTYGKPVHSMKKDVLCGESVTPYFYVWNSYSNKLPLDRQNLTLILDYPYEVQPKKITTLKCDQQTNFDIKYHVVNRATGAERDVEKQSASAGYAFEIEEEEYVSRIEIKISEMKKKDTLSFQTESLTQTKDREGNVITQDTRVPITGKLYMDDKEISDGTFYVDLKALKDDLFVNGTYDNEAVLEENNKISYYVGEIGLRGNSTYTKDYEDVVFHLNAPSEVMSKIIGYYVELERYHTDVIKGDLAVSYTTNKQEERSVSISEEEIKRENRIYLELEEDEYVTDISLTMGKIVGKRTYFSYSGSAISFAPIVNSKRTYFDADGIEQKVSFEQNYGISYDFSTISPPAINMTKDNLTTYVKYNSYETYQIRAENPGVYYIKNSSGTNISSGYRGDTEIVEVSPNHMSQTARYNRIEDRFYVREYIPLNQKYYFKNQLIYLEVEQGFEISGLTVPSVLVKKKKLDNDNNLFVFQLTSELNAPLPKPVKAKLYIRPDAEITSHNPVVNVGVSYVNYFQEHFPDYPECTNEKDTFPYQIVTLDEKQKEFPDNWGLTEEEKMYGMSWSFTKPEGSDGFTVRNVTTSTTQMMGTLDNLFQGEKVTFKEAQREQVGFTAFVSAVTNETVSDYTATFIIPKKDDIVQGKSQNYKAQYNLYGNGPMNIYLNGEPAGPNQSGISIAYYDKEDQKITGENWNAVRKIEVHFESLKNSTVYELTMPLCTDGKSGEDTSDWKSYIGTYNKTGNGTTEFLDPITYTYESYEIDSIFGLDMSEQGNDAKELPIDHTLTIYDGMWNEIYTKKISKDENASTSEKFNAKGKNLYYVGFSLAPEETEKYLATQARAISDISESQYNIHEFSDGTKIWYLPINQTDFITDTTRGKYDALFVRKPEITAENTIVAVGEEENLDYLISQPVNEDIVKNYKISVQLLTDEDNKDIVELKETNGKYSVKGLEKGTIPYEVTVTNTQGMEFTAKANITVGDKLYAPLPHVGGTGAKGIALAGASLIAGGTAFVLFRKKKKLLH